MCSGTRQGIQVSKEVRGEKGEGFTRREDVGKGERGENRAGVKFVHESIHNALLNFHMLYIMSSETRKLMQSSIKISPCKRSYSSDIQRRLLSNPDIDTSRAYFRRVIFSPK